MDWVDWSDLMVCMYESIVSTVRCEVDWVDWSDPMVCMYESIVSSVRWTGWTGLNRWSACMRVL